MRCSAESPGWALLFCKPDHRKATAHLASYCTQRKEKGKLTGLDRIDRRVRQRPARSADQTYEHVLV